MTDKAIEAFMKHGPWAVLAIILVGFFIWEVRPALADIKAEHAEMRAEEKAEAAELVHFMRRVVEAMDTSNYLQRVDCLNNAKTSEARNACAKDRDR